MDYQEFYQEMNTHYYRANCYHTMMDPDQDATSGNEHVLNATYHLISSKLGQVTHDDWLKEFKFAMSTVVSAGLYSRHPNKMSDPETFDDYIGLSVSSKVLNMSMANELNQYGINHHYYYNNLPGVKVALSTMWDYWHGKSPAVTAVYKRAAGQPIGVLNRAMFCLGIFGDIYFNKDRTSTSGRILQWLSNSVMKGESKMVDYCISKWEEKIKVDYPNGWMGEVLGVYHSYDHPFSRGMWGKM